MLKVTNKEIYSAASYELKKPNVPIYLLGILTFEPKDKAKLLGHYTFLSSKLKFHNQTELAMILNKSHLKLCSPTV